MVAYSWYSSRSSGRVAISLQIPHFNFEPLDISLYVVIQELEDTVLSLSNAHCINKYCSLPNFIPACRSRVRVVRMVRDVQETSIVFWTHCYIVTSLTSRYGLSYLL